MKYRNGQEALVALVTKLQTEATFVMKHGMQSKRVSYATAHEYVLDAMNELMELTENIRQSAESNMDEVF